jgi:hypothetical protein
MAGIELAGDTDSGIFGSLRDRFSLSRSRFRSRIASKRRSGLDTLASTCVDSGVDRHTVPIRNGNPARSDRSAR